MISKFELHTDVLVLGSGPSGFAAAYTAAKNGAKVVLVEQSNPRQKLTGVKFSAL